ncbi:MAG: mercury resistance protein [Betaproteobacteria bacterium]|nr:mercury resistance protein [Betaproteobacteria bacterium]
MAATNTTDPTSTARGVMSYVMGAIAVLTCPCHLPILILLFSGTAAGAFLSDNLGLATIVLLPIFLLSGFATWRLLDTGSSDEPAENSPRRPQPRNGIGGGRTAEP